VTLAEVKAEIDRRAALIGAPSGSLPTYGHSRDFGDPNIEIDNRGYHYVVEERGRELRRDTTTDLDELLYIVFSDVSFHLAGIYEVGHRVRHRDTRRLLFDHQIELLAKLSPAWAERCLREQAEVLSQHPFVDQ
jgi:hypothetical protein